MGEDVPIYLQTEVKVRNREYSKGDALEIIKDVWKAKNKLESEVIDTIKPLASSNTQSYRKPL